MAVVRLTDLLECLNSLNDPVARFRVQDVVRVRHTIKDTFEWLFTDQVPFSRWLSDDGGEYDAIFWITGKPGSGKSTLMRFAFEDSRTMSLQPHKTEEHPMAYFFHLRGKSLVQKSLRGMLTELLYQILQKYPHSFELIRPIFLEVKTINQPWDIQSLSRAILRIPHIRPAVPGSRDHITLFIDALDENQNQNDNNDLLKIFDDLLAAYSKAKHKIDSPILKICLASRPWPIFRKRLGDDPRVPSFAIHNFTTMDIQKYTKSRLITSTQMSNESQERQKAISRLSTDIATRAKGVFIWVRVVVDSLHQDIIDGSPIQTLQKEVDKYPEELDDMYKFTLSRIRMLYRLETTIIFKTLLASRIPLNPKQLYIITQTCSGLPQPVRYPLDESYDVGDTISWLTSRSGGLIDMVVANADDLYPPLFSFSEPKAPEICAEFLHQTVQDFVRNKIDGAIEIPAQPVVAQLSGSCFLACACLDSNPPHPDLREVAKDVFSYIREVEREDDYTQTQQMACLPHWKSFNLHDFPFRVRDPAHPSGCSQLGTEDYRHYMETQADLLYTSLHLEYPPGVDKLRYKTYKDWLPFFVAVGHGLYHTKGAEYFSELSAVRRQFARRIMLYIASVGPCLCKDRVDRPRMFRHILATYASEKMPTAASYELDKGMRALPLNERIDNVILDSSEVGALNLTTFLVSLKPSTEIDDDTLLALVKALDGEGYMDSVVMEFPETFSLAGDKKRIALSLPAFCSRFRDSNHSKWLELFRDTWDVQSLASKGVPGLNEERHSLIVDLAVCHAAKQQPPRHCYTDLAESGRVVAEAIASACLPAATVGIGGSHMFRAFYRSKDRRRTTD